MAIYDDYHDGSRIIQQLLALGKLQKIPSPIPQYTGVAAVDRSNVDIANFRSTLESRLHRCKLRWLLKHVKIHKGAKMKFDLLLMLASTILSLTENSILSNWGKQWHGWTKLC
ncbi:MAG: hypothetical protein ACLRXB_04380 [Escherichia coli]